MRSSFQDDRSTTLSNRMGLFRDLSRSTRTWQAQTNNKLSTAKIDISLKESKKHLRTKHQTSKGRFLEEKLICLASSLNNIKAG